MNSTLGSAIDDRRSISKFSNFDEIEEESEYSNDGISKDETWDMYASFKVISCPYFSAISSLSAINITSNKGASHKCLLLHLNQESDVADTKLLGCDDRRKYSRISVMYAVDDGRSCSNHFKVSGLLGRRPFLDDFTSRKCKYLKTNHNSDEKNVPLFGNDGRKTFTLTLEIPPEPKSNELNFQESDVLPGKGGLSNNHPGNIRYRALVQERRALYQDTSTSIAVKRSLSTEIVDHIILMGGRFLIEKNIYNVCRYGQMTVAKAVKKTSQALREKRSYKWINLS
jgi:hypothetical protein